MQSAEQTAPIRYIPSRDGLTQIAAPMSVVYGVGYGYNHSSEPYEGAELVETTDPEAWVRAERAKPVPAPIERPFWDYGFGEGPDYPTGMRYPRPAAAQTDAVAA